MAITVPTGIIRTEEAWTRTLGTIQDTKDNTAIKRRITGTTTKSTIQGTTTQTNTTRMATTKQTLTFTQTNKWTSNTAVVVVEIMPFTVNRPKSTTVITKTMVRVTIRRGALMLRQTATRTHKTSFDSSRCPVNRLRPSLRVLIRRRTSSMETITRRRIWVHRVREAMQQEQGSSATLDHLQKILDLFVFNDFYLTFWVIFD